MDVIENDELLPSDVHVQRDYFQPNAYSTRRSSRASRQRHTAFFMVSAIGIFTTGGANRQSKIFRRIVSSNQWTSFGFIAAEVDLKKL